MATAVIPFWLTLLTKLASSAAIVVAASLAVERAGPAIGALVATLPVSAGPAYAFLALDHDTAFLARSTLASLSVNVGTAPFILVYAVLAQRRGLLVSFGAAIAVWLGIAAVLSATEIGYPVAITLNALSYGSAYLLSRPYRTAPMVARAPSRRGGLPARVATVMTVVATVILAGRWLGPAAAGIAAMAPVVMTSLVLVMHPRAGGRATAAVLTGTIPGMIGFTVGLATLHLAVVPLGAASALLLALAVCVGWNGALLALTLRSAQVAEPRES